MRRNPSAPQRQTEKNARKTHERIQQYYGLVDLLRCWEETDIMVQASNHVYILKLRARVRAVKNMIMHRASPDADLQWEPKH